MCGIVGYVGNREIPSVLIDGLRRLEYRGYDSCGIAVLDDGKPKVVRALGRIRNLEEKMRDVSLPPNGTRCGIGHTRWATHGRPSETNAHPHYDCSGHFLVAHNGIIENYMELKQRLTEQGHRFKTETDTEVLPHLVESHFRGNLEDAVRAALREVEGVYGMVAISTHDSPKIVAARKGPPIVIGIGKGEHFIASDAPALLPYTRDMIFLNDCEIAVVRRDSIEFSDLDGARLSRSAERIDWCAEMAEKEGYPHFMLKEIFEQPNVIRNTLRSRVHKDGRLDLSSELPAPEWFSSIKRMYIVACGTSYYAALVGKFMIETLTPIHVEVDYASEFRYRNPRLDSDTMVVAITQSGETADTLAAMKLAREKGAYLVSICNVVGSSAARDSNSVLYTHAGPEIGVASTKAFTAQLATLYLLALHIGSAPGGLQPAELQRCIRQIQLVPEMMEAILGRSEEIRVLAGQFCAYQNFLYLGRGINYPIALEGALKLKEISYIHAEGYPAGEMKHGPIALIDSRMPVMTVVPQDSAYAKTMSNIEEVRVRDGVVLAIATEGDTAVLQKTDYPIFIPKADSLVNPLLTVIPLQLFAYYAAARRGCDVDRPRNLAKSVTVE